jgi:hypothetical protein
VTAFVVLLLILGGSSWLLNLLYCNQQQLIFCSIVVVAVRGQIKNITLFIALVSVNENIKTSTSKGKFFIKWR